MTRTDVQTKIAYALLARRQEPFDLETHHGAEYGCADAAWDDAEELMYEAESEAEDAGEPAPEGEALVTAALAIDAR